MSRACNILSVAERILCEILRHRPVLQKTKGHHLKQVPFFLLFVQNSWCSLKLHLKSLPDFLLFVSNQLTFPNCVPKQRCSLFRSETKVTVQEFAGHATHDFHTLTACHCFIKKTTVKNFYITCNCIYCLI